MPTIINTQVPAVVVPPVETVPPVPPVDPPVDPLVPPVDPPPPVPSVPPVDPSVPPVDPPVGKQVSIEVVESARKQERQKLQGQLTALTNKLAAADAECKQLTTTVSDLQVKLTTGKELDTMEIGRIAAETATTRLKVELGSRVTQLEGKLHEEQELRRSAELRNRKQELIDAAGGPDNVVVELIKGNTEEEMAASVTDSIRIRKEIEEAVKKTLGPGVGEPGTDLLQNHVPPIPIPAGREQPPGGGVARISGAKDLEAWKGTREAVLPELLARFSNRVRNGKQ